MVYKSKISWALLAPVILLLGGLSLFIIIDRAWTTLLVILLTSGFITYLYTHTYYTIMDNVLSVSTGLGKLAIDIASIKAIEETNTVLSAPALSLDRIEIFYNRYDSVVISPPDKTVFIAHLKSINNHIELN
jgi:hypothetical protein